MTTCSAIFQGSATWKENLGIHRQCFLRALAMVGSSMLVVDNLEVSTDEKKCVVASREVLGETHQAFWRRPATVI
jgi:hypothetical protein